MNPSPLPVGSPQNRGFCPRKPAKKFPRGLPSAISTPILRREKGVCLVYPKTHLRESDFAAEAQIRH